MKKQQTSLSIASSTLKQASELFAAHQQTIFKSTDRMFAVLMSIQWVAGVGAAVWITPRTWIGTESHTHIHVWASIFLGGAISILPITLALIRPGEASTRHVIATAQILMSALLIYLTGGRIETHFHVFGSLAFLAFYRDWRVLVPATLVVAVDHFLRGVFWPQTVYGVLSSSQWRWLEHVGWVLFEDAFLYVAIKRSVAEMWDIAVRTAEAHDLNLSLERRVAERTAEIVSANNGLQKEIAERKLVEDQLRQSQKMESIGTLAGGLAHDFNNLMTAVTGYSEMALRGLELTNPVRSKIDEIKKAGERAASLTRQLLAFSRKQVLQPKVLDLNTVVIGMSKMLPRMIGEDIELRIELAASLDRVEADPGQMEQILMNLAVNARDAMPNGGLLTIETRNVYLDGNYASRHAVVQAGHYAMLSVSDNGYGMDHETQAHIFEPFYTTKEVGKGTGLGLSMVYGIVKQSGGTIWVYSEEGKGTTFKIYLPRIDEVGMTEELGESSIAVQRGNETILLVEDEDIVRNLSKEILEDYGYAVVTAPNGQEGIRICRAFDGQIDLVITDVVMPQMSGRELAENVSVLRPDARVLFMSGFTNDAVVRHGVLVDDLCFIQKPFSPDALALKVREVLDSVRDHGNSNGSPFSPALSQNTAETIPRN